MQKTGLEYLLSAEEIGHSGQKRPKALENQSSKAPRNAGEDFQNSPKGSTTPGSTIKKTPTTSASNLSESDECQQGNVVKENELSLAKPRSPAENADLPAIEAGARSIPLSNAADQTDPRVSTKRDVGSDTSDLDKDSRCAPRNGVSHCTRWLMSRTSFGSSEQQNFQIALEECRPAHLDDMEILAIMSAARECEIVSYISDFEVAELRYWRQKVEMATRWMLEELDTKEAPRQDMARRMDMDCAGLHLSPRSARVILFATIRFETGYRRLPPISDWPRNARLSSTSSSDPGLNYSDL